MNIESIFPIIAHWTNLCIFARTIVNSEFVLVRRFSHVMPTKFIRVMWIIFLNVNASTWFSAVRFARELRDHPCHLECINFAIIRIFPWPEMCLCKVPHILELYLQFYTHRMRVEVFTWFTCRHLTQWVSMDNNEWEKASVQLNSCSWPVVKKPETVGLPINLFFIGIYW